MTRKEETRLQEHKEFLGKGKLIFERLKSYYATEAQLDSEDIYDEHKNIIKLNYLNKPYVLEIVYLESDEKGQIVIYESEIGTHFLKKPKFKLKEDSKIYFDWPGNVFLGSMTRAHFSPSESAEAIIAEIIK